MAIFPSEPGLAGFIGAKYAGGGDDNWSYKTCKAPVKSSPSTTTKVGCWPNFFTGRMPFLSSNQQRRSTEGKVLTDPSVGYIL